MTEITLWDAKMEKLHALGEVVVGSALMSMGFWGPVLDKAIDGAHAVATFGGAAVAVHGVWRIIHRTFGKTRRKEDR